LASLPQEAMNGGLLGTARPEDGDMALIRRPHLVRVTPKAHTLVSTDT
jgi:hypothetical protein